MKKIRTSNGYEVLVDDEDYETILRFSWIAELHGRKTKKPYVSTRIGGRKRRTRVFLSRMLMQEPDCSVDHINGDPLDNRRSNLRLATNQQNSRNSVKHHPVTSKFKGVSLRRNRHGGRYKMRPWIACIRVDRRQIKLGSFSDEIDAAKAYDRAAVEHFGVFARTNFKSESAALK